MQKTKLALLYDFDKTLCTKDMQEYTFIPNLKMTSSEFWKEATQLATARKMDRILAYMYLMLERAKSEKMGIRREDFVALGRDLEFFPGVETWFSRMNELPNQSERRLSIILFLPVYTKLLKAQKLCNIFGKCLLVNFCTIKTVSRAGRKMP